ncbi:MAG: RDD family protein [Campylobacterales bacterium]|nr:RDD family protein [Campylobacterales bacterium]
MRFRNIKKQSKLHKAEQLIVVPHAMFLDRAKAFITDIFMIGLPVAIIIMMLFGYDETKSAGALDVIVHNEKAITHAPDPIASIVQIVLILGIHVILWRKDGQTPGKKFAHIKVVDASTLKEASYLKLIVRFIGYFVSILPLGLGFFLGFLREDKRTLHDLLSGTAVIYTKHDMY